MVATDGEDRTGIGRNSANSFYAVCGKKRSERPNVGGVSIRSRNGAPFRKECVVNGQMTEASNKCVRPPLTCLPLTSPPPPA